jgi:hypothetical protein
MSGKAQTTLRGGIPILVDALSWPPFIILAVMYWPNTYRSDYGALPPPIATTAWLGALLVLTVSFVARELRNERVAMTCIYVVAALAVVVTINKVASLIRILHVGQGIDGWQLLETGVIVWSDNVLIFSLLYWALDRGGPIPRKLGAPPSDWLFPEMSLEGYARTPNFVDYLCLAFNTSTAFSPTDVATLSTRARALMAVQSSISLATLAIVAARAVNILS